MIAKSFKASGQILPALSGTIQNEMDRRTIIDMPLRRRLERPRDGGLDDWLHVIIHMAIQPADGLW